MFTHGSPVAFCAVEMEARHGVVASKWSSSSTCELLLIVSSGLDEEGGLARCLERTCGRCDPLSAGDRRWSACRAEAST